MSHITAAGCKARLGWAGVLIVAACGQAVTANLRSKILDFGGSDSSIILKVEGGIPRPTENFPESLSHQIFVGRFLVGRLVVTEVRPSKR